MLTFQIIVGAKKKLPTKEQYTKEEVKIATDELKKEFEVFNGILYFGDDPYDVNITSFEFVAPTKPLASLSVNLPALRSKIAELMSTGTDELSVPDLLQLIRTVYRSDKD